MLPNKINLSKRNKGSEPVVCARVGGANTTLFLAAHFTKRNSAAAEKNWNRKARAGKNSFPPTPFLFARPSDWILKFGIRIFLKKCSNINQKTPHEIFTFNKLHSIIGIAGMITAVIAIVLLLIG